MNSTEAALKRSSDSIDDVENIQSLEALTTHEEDSKTFRTTELAKKQRVKRFFNSLLCCISRRSKNAHCAVPLQTDLNSGRHSPKPSEELLLPPVLPCDTNKKCLIVDLDETLVHSSFKPVKNPDFIIPVEIDGVVHQVYVLKRPHVDEFLRRIGPLFECILFTASLAKYADPVADLLDKTGIFRVRLFRESCVFHKGNYVKDLNRLGRDLKQVVIVDNSPASYTFHPDNAVPVQSWFDNTSDTELLEIIPYLERLSAVDNVYKILRNPALFPRPAPDHSISPPSAVINITNTININIIGTNDNNNDKSGNPNSRMITVRSLGGEETRTASSNRVNGVVCFASVVKNRSSALKADESDSSTPRAAANRQPIGIEDVIMSVERPTR